MISFRYFCFFIVFVSSKKYSGFVVALYKGLVEFLLVPPTCETVLACLIALVNLSERFWMFYNN